MTRSAAPPDGSLEQKFRHCGLAPTLLQSEWVCAGFVALNAVLGVTEGTAGFSAGAVGAVAACRVTAATLALTSLALIRRARRETGSRVRLEALVVTSWSAQLLCAAVAAGAAATLGPPGATSPFSALQWWSSAWGMTHAVLMLASGLRAPLIAALAAAQAVSTAGGFAAPWSAPDPTVVASFVLLVLGCVYVAFSHEATSRAGFLGECSREKDGGASGACRTRLLYAFSQLSLARLQTGRFTNGLSRACCPGTSVHVRRKQWGPRRRKSFELRAALPPPKPRSGTAIAAPGSHGSSRRARGSSGPHRWPFRERRRCEPRRCRCCR